MENITYYRLPDMLWLVLVPFGMGYVSICYLLPSMVPFSYMGSWGILSSYLAIEKPILMTIIFYLAWFIHCMESLYAVHICRQMNQKKEVVNTWKWAISVAIWGLFSFKDLLHYKNKHHVL